MLSWVFQKVFRNCKFQKDNDEPPTIEYPSFGQTHIYLQDIYAYTDMTII